MSEHPAADAKRGPAEPLQGVRAAGLDSAARGVAASRREGAKGAVGEGTLGSVTLERPKRAEFGDYSTNAALLLAPGLGTAPRELAERLGAELADLLGDSLERFEVAGPGFLNLFLSDDWVRE